MTDDKGGLLPPGLSSAVNDAGKPETVTHVSQADWHWDERMQMWVYDSGWIDGEAG